VTGTDKASGRRRWWQQPSLHFLLIGVALFAAYQWAETRQGADGKTIIVDRQALLTHMQYRARAFEPAQSAATLDRLDENELAALVDDYVREEVLYREALALGLDRNDFVIRQRLIQKLEFINRDLTEEMTELSDDEVQRYFAAHRDTYIQPAQIAFSQVFLSRHGNEAEVSRDHEGEAGRDAVMSRAESILADLNARQVPPREASRYGDEFSGGADQTDQSPEQIAGQFGQEFSEAVFALEAQPDRWQGPLQSPHGFHLLLITESIPERMLELAEAEKAVREDARRDRIDERNRAILQEIVDAYDVQVTVQPGSPGTLDDTPGSQQ
jgi:hypothetical protein